MTGTGDATIFSTVSRIASIRPPGVLRRSKMASAFSRLAWSMARETISTVTGWTMPFTSTAMTFGDASDIRVSSKATTQIGQRIDINRITGKASQKSKVKSQKSKVRVHHLR